MNTLFLSFQTDPKVQSRMISALLFLMFHFSLSLLFCRNLSSRQLTGSLPHNITRLAYLEYLYDLVLVFCNCNKLLTMEKIK